MSSSTATRGLRLVVRSLLALSLLLVVQTAGASAQEPVTVKLEPLFGSRASGLATVTTASEGKATVEMRLSGLTPGGQYYGQLTASTCAMPNAISFLLGTFDADAAGNASLSANSARSIGGMISALEIAGMADGGHILSVVSLSQRMVVACGAIPKVEVPSPQQAGPQFKLGFATLAALIPDIVGQPRENEHYGPNGDSLQQTTTGLMAWRKADNWTAFTDGYMTWINGPYGLQTRLNTERFDWEAGGQ